MLSDEGRRRWLRALALLGLLALALLLAWAMPRGLGRNIAGYEPLHTLLETIAIVIASMVFAIGWNAHQRELPVGVSVLATLFLGVALLDFSHALSYAGMPDYVTPSGPEKAINFWLAARSVAALGLFAAVLAPPTSLRRPGLRYLLLALVLGATLAIHGLFLYRSEVMPRTFIPGSGLTDFKRGWEYLLIAGYLAAAAAVWSRRAAAGERAQAYDAPAMFVAAATMAMSEVCFTLYTSATDAYNLLGHVYKLIAYLALYRAVFVVVVERPYRLLHDTQDRLRTTLATIPDLLWLKDRQGVYLDCNPTFERLYGAPRERILGRRDEDFVSPELAAFFREHDNRAMLSGRPSVNEEWLDFAADGYRGLFETVKTPLYSADGELIGVLGIARDISERRQAEIERRQLEAQLRESQKMEALGALAGGIAHDFNNVLGAISGNAALAARQLAPEHPAQQQLGQIAVSSRRARDMVQQILAFSRRQPMQRVELALRPLLEESLQLLRATLPAGVALRPELPEAEIRVQADATQIQQVLMNLCTNAWHALPELGGSITVGLELSRQEVDQPGPSGVLRAGLHAHLWVHDDGHGMDETTRSRLFEPFFTTKPSGQGTGLGLAVVHGIVAAHGGSIRVDSAPGQGTTFHVYLPAAASPAAAPPRTGEAPDGQSRQEPRKGHGEHVLCIDDDEVMLTMVEGLLQGLGYRVTGRTDAAGALELLRQAPESFDVLITDFNMPGRSGLEVAEAAAAIRPGLPVVISSGYISDALQQGSARLGVVQLMRKERTLEDLPVVLARLFEPALR